MQQASVCRIAGMVITLSRSIDDSPRRACRNPGMRTWIAAGLLLTACGGSKPPTNPSPIDASEPSESDAAPSACHTPLPPAPTGASRYVLRFDQLGYARAGKRWAVLLSAGEAAPHVRVYALATECFLSEASAGPRVLDVRSRAGTPLTGDRVDLSAAGQSGDYLLVLDDGTRLGPFHVADAPYAPSLTKMVSFLRAQRCGKTTQALSKHAACHLFSSVSDGDSSTKSGDGVAVDDNYSGTVNDSAGAAVNVEGGWHDAGDYIKFTGTTAFMLATDLVAIRDHHAALSQLLGPAGYDDLRAEMRWGLDWLLAMLGGPTMYHQVSGPRDHQHGFRLPEDDTHDPAPGYSQRPAFKFSGNKGANILGRAAAAFAAGSQIFADDPAYSAQLLAAARKVYAEGKQRMNAQNPVPADFYHESSVRDDLALGAAELARATGETRFRDDAIGFARQLDDAPGSPIYWGGLDALALLETGLAFPEGSHERGELATQLGKLAEPIRRSASDARGPGAAFAYALEDFGNGTIEQSLGAAAVCLAARRLAGKDQEDCVEVARNQLHWLFGQNPFGVSFQIGVGSKFPQHPHHALASTAHIVLEGAIVGGPTGIDVIRGELPVPGANDPYAKWSTDALFYEDNEGDWVVNEPAIDFTGPLLFVMAELAEG
jgi:endoglucanase